jgi:DNA-binding NarL/FixJ family response regulator
LTIRVVLADDEPLVRSGIAMLLASDAEIEVVAEVADGQAAVTAATELRPDVVVMDVRMAGMDGVEATRRITRSFPPDPTGRAPVAVLMLTTYNLDEAVYSALSAGAAGFLLKDAVPAELLAAIKAIAAGEGWLDPGVTRSLIREFAARAGGEPAVVGSPLERLARPTRPAADTPDRSNEAVLRREGEYWTVAYDGEVQYLKDSVGLLYLSRLLARPGREIHALDLVSARGVAETDSGHAGPVLDERAKAEYRRRLTDLQEDIEEADRWADSARASALRNEMDQIIDELARGTGLGGRDRVAASAAERARVNVTKAIKATVKRIGQGNRALGRHLDVSVQTGTFCSYAPEDPSAIDWRL